MRNNDYTTAFKRDFRRALKGRYRRLLVEGGELEQVIIMLSNDEPLPPLYRGHALHNNLEGFRECHLRPDFLLLYRYAGDDWLILEGLGSHSDLLGL